MRSVLPWLLCLIPLTPLVCGLAALASSPRRGRMLGDAGGVLALAFALASAVGLAATGALVARLGGLGDLAGLAPSLRLDAVSAAMAVLVSFVGAVVLRFSRHYLDGDPRQARFTGWLCLTLASVLTLVLAGNLALLLVAWVTTSLCLHRLLLHRGDRPGAVLAARKKFVVSRLAELSLAGGAVVLHGQYGTLELDALFAAASSTPGSALTLACGLFAFGAILKSAQFPFHSWLPDTMETPTPVSAFMHAGIINAGGFLIVRLAPLFALVPEVLAAVAIVGALTAAYGAIVMLAQPGVKRALAYSTVAQMGFMMLQCGLGAFGLALLHIAAHSLYKAHAFLRSGSTIGAEPRAAIRLETPALVIGSLAAALSVAAGATLLHLTAPALELHLGLFAFILALAVGYALARVWSAHGGAPLVARGVSAALAIAVASLALHAGSAALTSGLPRVETPALLLGSVAAIFAGLFLFQALLWRAGGSELGRRLYVHALNGFSVGTLMNRLLDRAGPRLAA